MKHLSHRRILFSFTVILLFFILLLGRGSQSCAQGISQNVVCTVKWQLPSNLHEPSDLSLISRVSENGYLYLFNPTSGVLSVFQPGDHSPSRYTLSPSTPFDPKTVNDFVPFGNKFVIMVSSGAPLYKYDLQSQSLSTLSLQSASTDTACDPMGFIVGFPAHNITRIGNTDSVLICSLDTSNSIPEQVIYKLTLVNVSTQTASDIIQFPSTMNQIKWNSVVGGNDGKIYVFEPILDTIPQTLVPNFTSVEGSNYIVLRYDPQIAQWDFITIPRSSVSIRGSLTTVDSQSNLYFTDYANGVPSQNQIVKITASGSLDWILTKDDLGNAEKLLNVTANGSLFLIRDPESATEGGLVQECAVNTSSTSTLSPTPTLNH